MLFLSSFPLLLIRHRSLPCLATSYIRNKFDRVRQPRVSTRLRADERANDRAYLRVESYPALSSSSQDSIVSGSVCRADNPSVQGASCLSHSHGVVTKTKAFQGRARKDSTNVCLVFPKKDMSSMVTSQAYHKVSTREPAGRWCQRRRLS